MAKNSKMKMLCLLDVNYLLYILTSIVLGVCYAGSGKPMNRLALCAFGIWTFTNICLTFKRKTPAKKPKASAEPLNNDSCVTLSLKCPKCGKPLVVKKGKYGEFIGCSGFPSCKFSQGIKTFLEKQQSNNKHENKLYSCLKDLEQHDDYLTTIDYTKIKSTDDNVQHVDKTQRYRDAISEIQENAYIDPFIRGYDISNIDPCSRIVSRDYYDRGYDHSYVGDSDGLYC